MAYILKDYEGQEVKHNGESVYGADAIGLVKKVDLDKRELTIIGTTEAKDRDGDIIEVGGWELGPYLDNPVFLWAHDHSGVPIGAAKKVTRKRNPFPHMLFRIRFPSKIGAYPFADMLLELYDDDIIRASSVGFIPKKWEDIPEEESNQHSYYRGRRFTKQELLELSGCAVPSNPEALAERLKSFGGMQAWDDEKKSRFAEFLLQGRAVEPEERDKAMEVVESITKKGVEFDDEFAPTQIYVEGWDSANEQKTETAVDEDALGELIDKDVALKPYPNEHACRLKDPDQYDRFRRKKDAFGEGIHAIYGIKEDKAELQALRFDKDKFSASEAKKWCKEHKHNCILFEPATDAAADSTDVKSDEKTITLSEKDLVDLLELSATNALIEYDEELNSYLKGLVEQCDDAPVVLSYGEDDTLIVCEYDEETDTKTGQVLSAKNKANLRKAKALIQEVLDAASGTDGDDDKNADYWDTIFALSEGSVEDIDQDLSSQDNDDLSEEDCNELVQLLKTELQLGS